MLFRLEPKQTWYIYFIWSRAQASASSCLRLLKQEQFSPEKRKSKQLEPVRLKRAVGANKQSAQCLFEQ